MSPQNTASTDRHLTLDEFETLTAKINRPIYSLQNYLDDIKCLAQDALPLLDAFHVQRLNLRFPDPHAGPSSLQVEIWERSVNMFGSSAFTEFNSDYEPYRHGRVELVTEEDAGGSDPALWSDQEEIVHLLNQAIGEYEGLIGKWGVLYDDVQVVEAGLQKLPDGRGWVQRLFGESLQEEMWRWRDEETRLVVEKWEGETGEVTEEVERDCKGLGVVTKGLEKVVDKAGMWVWRKNKPRLIERGVEKMEKGETDTVVRRRVVRGGDGG